MKNVKLVKHPVVKDLVTRLRDVTTISENFRQYTHEVSKFLVYEALSDLKTKEKKVTTQTEGVYSGDRITENVKFFGVLREGIGMMNPALDTFPNGEFDLVGVKRNDKDPFNKKPVIYLNKFKDIGKHIDRVVLMDQMLATGGTMMILLDSLINENGFEGKVDILSIIVAKVGADNIYKKYPKVKITCAGFDTELNDGVNDVGYIYPGLGDASDRYFGIVGNESHVKN